MIAERVQDSHAQRRDRVREDESVQPLLRERTLLQLLSQIGVVVLELLVQERNLELLLPMVLEQKETAGKDQEKDDETEEQLRAKGGLLHT